MSSTSEETYTSTTSEEESGESQSTEETTEESSSDDRPIKTTKKKARVLSDDDIETLFASSFDSSASSEDDLASSDDDSASASEEVKKTPVKRSKTKEEYETVKPVDGIILPGDTPRYTLLVSEALKIISHRQRQELYPESLARCVASKIMYGYSFVSEVEKKIVVVIQHMDKLEL